MEESIAVPRLEFDPTFHPHGGLLAPNGHDYGKRSRSLFSVRLLYSMIAHWGRPEFCLFYHKSKDVFREAVIGGDLVHLMSSEKLKCIHSGVVLSPEILHEESASMLVLSNIGSRDETPLAKRHFAELEAAWRASEELFRHYRALDIREWEANALGLGMEEVEAYEALRKPGRPKNKFNELLARRVAELLDSGCDWGEIWIYLRDEFGLPTELMDRLTYENLRKQVRPHRKTRVTKKRASKRRR